MSSGLAGHNSDRALDPKANHFLSRDAHKCHAGPIGCLPGTTRDSKNFWSCSIPARGAGAGVRKPTQRRKSRGRPRSLTSVDERVTRLPLEPAFSLGADLIQMSPPRGSLMERPTFAN